MMRTYKMIFAVAAVLVSAAGLSSTAKAQQWGPSAQSRYYHNPGNPPTYMNYNTSVAHTPTPTPAATRPAVHAATPAQGSARAAAGAMRAARPHNVAAVRPAHAIRLSQAPLAGF